MADLTIMRGVSGSGKSTKAQAMASFTGAVVVSRDSIREANFGTNHQDYYQAPKKVLRAKEDLVTKIHNTSIESALKAGFNVIVDNTHVDKAPVAAAVAIGVKCGATIKIESFAHVPLATALAQNRARRDSGGRFVPEDVIKTQHSRLQASKDLTVEDCLPEVNLYSGTPSKPKAFLVDIDGTLAHMRNYRQPFDWHKVGLDDPDEFIVDIVKDLIDTPEKGDYKYTCIVMSGRDASCRKETEKWLNENDIMYDFLFMRPEKDMRKDSIVKAELFDKYVRDNFDVRFVLDDRNQVVDMWRAMGLKCLQVAEGDF